jgi:hypothetical protein
MKERHIRFDWACRSILRNKANFDVLEGFLKVLIGQQITIEEIVEGLTDNENDYENLNRIDILAHNSKGEPLLVEIQNTHIAYFYQSIAHREAKAVTRHNGRGDFYERVKKVYAIGILYLNIGRGSDYLYLGKGNTFSGFNTGNTLTFDAPQRDALLPRNPVEIHPDYILVCVRDFDKVATTPLEEWLEYLKSGQIADNTASPGLLEAKQKLQYRSMSPSERRAYEGYYDNLRIENDIIQTAIERGKAEGRKIALEERRLREYEQPVRKMNELGITTDIIKKATGLSDAEIAKIIHQRPTSQD